MHTHDNNISDKTLDVAVRKIVKFMTRDKTCSRRRAAYLKEHFNDYVQCFVFQIESDKIRKHFDLFSDQKYISNGVVNRIAKTDNNVVFRVMHERDGYIASTVFKTMLCTRSYNLLFEYNVGCFINKKCGIFHCFVETFGLVVYQDHDLECMITSNRRTNRRTGNDFYSPYITKSPTKDFCEDTKSPENLSGRCKMDGQPNCSVSRFDSICLFLRNKENNLGLITQYIRGNSLAESMNSIYSRYNLLYILYQIYMPLSVLSNQYTHYDLHAKNILLYKFGTNSHVTFHYHLSRSGCGCSHDMYAEPQLAETSSKDHTTKPRLLRIRSEEIVSFNSKFIVKIIDYGRSFFNDTTTPSSSNTFRSSEQVYDRIYDVMSPNFGPTYNREYNTINGLEFGSHKHNYGDFFISSVLRNSSHDLRLIHELKKDYFDYLQFNKPLFDLMQSVEYGVGIRDPKYKTYGTKEQSVSGLSRGKIVNVYDMHYSLKLLMKYEESIALQNEYYSASKKVGDLHIYDDDRPFEYTSC